GDDGSLAGHGAGARHLARGAGHGRRLRPQLVARARPAAAAPDAAEGVRAPGDGVTTRLSSPAAGLQRPESRRPVRPVRGGVVGLGYWGPTLVRTMQEVEEAELVAICASRPEALAKVGRRYPGIRQTCQLDDLLLDQDVDAVVIATPVSTHHALVSRALL